MIKGQDGAPKHLRLIIALKEGSFTRQVKMKTKWRIKRTVAMCASFNADKYKKKKKHSEIPELKF